MPLENPHELNCPSSATFARMSGDLLTQLPSNFRTALTGPHRTGKTTLAKAYAGMAGIPYVDASVTHLLKEGGIDSSANYSNSIGKRLDAQMYLLERIDTIWDKTHGGLITDRSPLCFAMYTLCDITGATEMNQAQCDQLIRYLNDCKAITLKHFNTLVLMPLNPKIELVAAPGKATANPAYIHHLYTTIHHLYSTLGRREDAAPEDISADAYVSDAAYDLSVGESLKPLLEKVGRWGPLAERLFELFTEEAGLPIVQAVLPHDSVTVEERVEWLSRLNQYQLYLWLYESMNQCQESPLVCQDMLAAQASIDMKLA